MDFSGKGNRDEKLSFDDIHTANWLEDEKSWEDLGSTTENRDDYEKKGSIFRRSKHSAFDDFKEAKPKEKVELSINLGLPRFLSPNKLKKGLRTFKKRKYTYAAIGLTLLVLGTFGLHNMTTNDTSQVAGVSSTGRSPDDPLPVEKPSFRILYPGGKDEASVGGVVRVSPDGNDPVYGYIDKVGETDVKVTQQSLPEAFKRDPIGQLEKTAKDFQATQLFVVDGEKVYHGKSSSGIQSLVFIKGNLLIFIKSSAELQEETWVAYISALHG